MPRKLLRLLVLALGLLYVVLAIAGFTAISDDTTVGGELQGGNPPELLWGVFSVNTVLNFIHFLLGALTIGSGVVVDRTKMGAWMVTIGFGLLLAYDIVSMLAIKGTDPLAINGADVWLHGITLGVLIAVSVVPVARPEGGVKQAESPTGAPSEGSRPR